MAEAKLHAVSLNVNLRVDDIPELLLAIKSRLSEYRAGGLGEINSLLRVRDALNRSILNASDALNRPILN